MGVAWAVVGVGVSECGEMEEWGVAEGAKCQGLTQRVALSLSVLTPLNAVCLAAIGEETCCFSSLGAQCRLCL